MPGLLPLSLKERPDDGRETITTGLATSFLHIIQAAGRLGLPRPMVSRMEAWDPMTVKAHPHNLERVLTALERRGVVIEEDGIRLTNRRR